MNLKKNFVVFALCFIIAYLLRDSGVVNTVSAVLLSWIAWEIN